MTYSARKIISQQSYQLKTHQDTNESVVKPKSAPFHCKEDKSFALSAPTIMWYLYAYNAILQPPKTMRRVDVVLAATPNQCSSGLIRCCSTSTIDNDIMALMQCPSVLSAPTLMGCLCAYNSILQPPTTMRMVDVVLAATPNQHSSGQIRRCSTSTIDNESMALMQCPSVLSAPTLMCHFYIQNAILQPRRTSRR